MVRPVYLCWPLVSISYWVQNDWRKQINPEMPRPDIRIAMMAALDEKGRLLAKRAIERIADILGISPATAYNDWKADRKTRK